MEIPYALILNIIISQLFLCAANCIIEILQNVIVGCMDIVYTKCNSSKFDGIFWLAYKKYFKQVVMFILFVFFGVILTLILMELKKPSNPISIKS